MLSITLIIVIITGIISFTALSNEKVMNDLVFYPPAVSQRNQYYRFFSCGLIHADMFHLIFNMYALYIFGETVERAFVNIFHEKGKLLYLLMYISALAVCLLPTYNRHKNDYHYRSLGASGAIAAVIFAYIILAPLNEIGLIFLPGVGIPGFIFGALYLIISSIIDKRGGGNINHSAHIWGSIYGMVFLIGMGYLFDYPVLKAFLKQIQQAYF